MDRYILDADGVAVLEPDFMKFGEWFEKTDRTVAKSKLDGSLISTVFIGYDHRIGDGPPLLFETLVFDGPMDGEMDRYSTREQAVAGHASMVERVTACQAP